MASRLTVATLAGALLVAVLTVARLGFTEFVFAVQVLVVNFGLPALVALGVLVLWQRRGGPADATADRVAELEREVATLRERVDERNDE